MQLSRLDIKGFKSFGDKITIHFNEGVTAIVGPNGCGKSNVVDAIRWVLGEQSTRMLRSEKMENIIFNGTKSRKPSNLAEVSLTFDNTKNVLPTEFSQVTLTRKLYRSGESEYRLNDVQCRLKDITDLFLDTGIGPDSYSIIELKMIDEIIANKEGSRRALFEEASGISKYKLRKKQTLSKLKDTEADLSRVDDLLFEIEKNLKTLENQAKKAERYYRLKEQYKALSVMLASFRIISFRDKLQEIEDREQKQELERSGISTEIDKLEALLQQQKLDSLTKEKNLSAQQKATNEFIASIRAYESEKKIRNEQLKYLQEKEKRLTEELEKDRNQLNHVQYNQKRLAGEQQAEQDILGQLTQSVNEHRANAEALKLKQQQAREIADGFSKEQSSLQNAIYTIEKEIAVLNIQKEALEQESTRTLADTENKEAELTEFTKAVARLEAEHETRQQEYQTAKDFEEKLQEQLDGLSQQLDDQKAQLSVLSRSLDAKQNEYNLTKSMVDNLEGFPESIRFIKKSAVKAKQAPLFSDILFCKEEYRIAIENYLEPVMNHYVVDTRADAIEAVNLLSDTAKGRASFFILDSFTKKSAAAIEAKGLIAALDIIEVDSKYSALCTHLLQNVFITDTDDPADVQAIEKLVILSKSGKFNLSERSLSGGSVGLFEGKRIGRAKNLDNLSKELKKLETDISRITAEVDKGAEKIQSLKTSSKASSLPELQSAANRVNNELISVKTRQEQYRAFIENSQTRKQDIEEKIRQATESLILAEPRLVELKAQLAILGEQVTASAAELSKVSAEATESSSVYNAENLRYHQQLNKVSSIEKDIEYRNSQEKHLTERITKASSELDTAKADIQASLKNSDTSDEDLTGMYAQKEEFEKGVTAAEEVYFTSRGQISETENTISQLRRNREQNDLLVNELKDQKTNLKLDLNALKERLSVEFNVDIAELVDAETPEHENEDDLRDRTEKIKKQLDDFGAINPMAMEAYQEMNERFTFITGQKKDLTDARHSLLETIQEIDDTAREKFMAAFTHVRENFITVFRSLFNEEDSCDLLLTDETNPLEADIEIIAKPKGKRPLSINQLSGGEKTLTSTALLFSLYLLKPAPFCIFDEVDAPLDDTNIDKFNNIIRKFSSQSQFIIVSHNKRTIASTDIIYGVTMVEQGVSKVVAVDIRDVAA